MDAIAMNGLIEEFGGTAEVPMNVTAEKDGSWTVWWDDVDILNAEWADDPPRLVSTIPLGKVAPSRRLVVYEAVLTYNLLWRQTSGARMGLGGPDGDVTLIHEIQAEQLTVPSLGAALAKACRIAGAWRRFVLKEDSEASGLSPSSPYLLA
jgi:hypothetical protein